ncbi:hypothetical protein LSH36_201g04045 [Paralvinella palmiformis]|uniref:Uncharacterized protein n=1 Tax=Paralvinella palmiformis TaxID=53620 RepID=A0AAD9N502_9ANNE|nr:hypothetical protein LSH36_201g04045 [Paralvinella palmiformis]
MAMENRYALLLKPGAHYDSGEDEGGRNSQDYAAFLLSKDGGGNKQKCLTVVDLVAKKRQDDKEYDRRLNIIEDHMWQYKQQERELKRLEGDIIKNQREVRRSLRDYENGKRMY